MPSRQQPRLTACPPDSIFCFTHYPAQGIRQQRAAEQQQQQQQQQQRVSSVLATATRMKQTAGGSGPDLDLPGT